jgi:pimeloyl-ACP methyl ester carboxylesterase
MQKFIATFLVVLCVASSYADGPQDNIADKVRQIPPPGIELNAEVRGDLHAELTALKSQVASLDQRRDARTAALLPDVEVFARAVDQALRFNELFAEGDILRTRQVLAEGRRRAEQLLAGEAPWTRQTGLVVRGYRSRLDDTVQPYGLVIPDSYQFEGPQRYRCDLWFHGRGETSVEVQFIQQRMRSPGEFTPPDTIVLHPFGRYSNAFKFAGEVDVLEALEHAQSQYRIDEDRISARGFSMGGAAAWQFAVHYADRWFAANPGAGFSETPEFLKAFQQETLDPTWWEERLWQLYDCPLWVLNLRQCPTIAYSGELDRQKQAADVMEQAFRDLARLEMVHVIGPQTAHKIHPDSKVEIERRMRDLARQGRDRVPERVWLRTCTLKYNRMHWVTINRLAEHWTSSGVDARIVRGAERLKILVTPLGVTDLTLEFGPGDLPSGLDQPPDVVLFAARGTAQEEPLSGEPPVRSDGSWTCRLFLTGANPYKDAWKIGTPPSEGDLRKRHDLQGPVDDAFMDSFLFVQPGNTCRHEQVEVWVRSELDHAIRHWRQQMRGDARVKADRDITEDDIARHNLVLWGDPASNSVLARIADRLPVRWGETEVVVGDQRYDAAVHAPILISPNPLNPRKYVVLNSSFTYREYDYLNNARQTPKLPDWAIVDLREAPGSRWPGKIVAADFFDEEWQLKPANAGGESAPSPR